MGGGQPVVSPKVKREVDVYALRSGALYQEDVCSEIRLSHENPYIQKLYDEFLGKPNGHLAHHLFHTSYVKRDLLPDDLLARKTVSSIE